MQVFFEREWHRLKNEEVLNYFNSSNKGLNDFTYQENLKKFGANVFSEEQRVRYLNIFLSQFKSPLVYILLISAVIVFVLGDVFDAGIIFFVVMMSVILGAIQEGKAEHTIMALKQIIKSYAVVLRNGEEKIVQDSDLVPGDIILLKDGNAVPADARILESNELKINQSILTGESELVLKNASPMAGTRIPVADRINMIYRGTYVVSGLAKAVIVNVGAKTIVGQISKKLGDIKIKIPLQQNIENLSRMILFFVAIFSVIIFLYGLFVGFEVLEMFMIVVALSVSAIPESLPIAVTVVLAMGVWRMSQKQVLVKKLKAVEVLGRANIIALDKTGTITKNQMTVGKVYTNGRIINVTGSGYNPTGEFYEKDKYLNPEHDADLYWIGHVAVLTAIADFQKNKNEWKLLRGDPTEAALIILGHKIGLNKIDLENNYPKLYEIPFDLNSKHHSSAYEIEDKKIFMSAGSPEVILANCTQFLSNGKHKKITETELNKIHEQIGEFSAEGYRILALAMSAKAPTKQSTKLPALSFVGLVGIVDAIREEVPHAMHLVQNAGLRAVMITGDRQDTAENIARKIGIFNEGDIIITGQEMDELSEDSLADKIEKISVFARVTPEHKLKIIQAFKKRGLIVAMTGDGVNDALSLTAADLGVAMGKNGSEVAKEAADFVLLDDNFGNLVLAAEEGRNIYLNIRKVLLYLFATSLGEVMVIAFALFLGIPIPLSATQILWLNLITETCLIAFLVLDPKDKNLLREKFNKPSKYIVDRSMFIRIFLIASLMTIVTLLMFNYFLKYTYFVKASTIAMTTLSVFLWYNIFNVRSENKSIFKRYQLKNPYLFFGLFSAICLQLLAIYNQSFQKILDTTALTANEWGMILVVCLSIVLLEEVRKLISNLLSRKRVM